MTTYIINARRFAFSNCRDAIDAVSAYEASTLDDLEYDIRKRHDTEWVVITRDTQTNQHGFLHAIEAS